MIKSMIIAFSMYSRIPMPVFTWKEDDMKHVIDFLPLVGIVIGILTYAGVKIGVMVNMPVFALMLLLMIIPLMVTGGFHVDGFMDVQDALNSYQSPENKLEIMKDPHIGAFAVIRLLILGLLWACALYCVTESSLESGNFRYLWIYSGAFTFIRALCGIFSITLARAKKNGMLNMETEGSRKTDVVLLSLTALCSGGFLLLVDLMAGGVCILGIILFTIYYKNMCHKEFGGVTGDTAGYYIVAGECMITAVLGILSLVMN